jgi:uncharacterized protein with PQ loop repeat
MKTLINKLIVFLLVLASGYVLVYVVLDRYYNPPLKASDNNIFIWGDSQMYQGLDLELMSQQTGKKIYSAAMHGAGVYDFLVFTERVPENAQIVLSISKLVQVRRIEKDRNQAGISMSSILKMASSGYSISALKSIVLKNFKPKKLMFQSSVLYENLETPKSEKDLKNFISYYQKVPEFLTQKEDIITLGIDRLKSKKCSIIYVNFPFHPRLDSIEQHSPIKEITDHFYNKIYKDLEADTLFLDNTSNVMYDLSHLNKRGATLVTNHLSNKIQEGRFEGALNVEIELKRKDDEKNNSK